MLTCLRTSADSERAELRKQDIRNREREGELEREGIRGAGEERPGGDGGRRLGEGGSA